MRLCGMRTDTWEAATEPAATVERRRRVPRMGGLFGRRRNAGPRRGRPGTVGQRRNQRLSRL